MPGRGTPRRSQTQTAGVRQLESAEPTIKQHLATPMKRSHVSQAPLTEQVEPTVDDRPASSARKGELTFRQSIENRLLSGITVVDLEGSIIYVNPTFCKMTGWEAKELIVAKPPYLFWSDQEREHNMRALLEVMSGEKAPEGLNLRLQKKNGTYLDVLMTFSELKDGAGNTIGWVHSYNDISALTEKEEEVRGLNLQLEQQVVERTALLQKENEFLRREIELHRSTEKALRDSEKRFRALVTASSDVVYRMSPDWGEMRTLKERGFVPDTETPITDWLLRYIHPDDQKKVMAFIKKALRTKSVFELEHRVLRRDGTLGWVFSRAVPLLDAHGDVVEWFGTASDITERRRADELRKALSGIHLRLSSDAEQEEIMENVLEEAARALDCESAVIYLRAKTNWTVRHVCGLPQGLIGTQVSDEEESHVLLAINTGDPVAIEDACNDERVNRQHIERYGIRSILVVPVMRGMAGLGVFSFNFHASVTRFTSSYINFSRYLATATSLALQRWSLIEGLRERTGELERANVELEAFAHTVSHDLRNPLVATRGFCQRLAERQGERLDEKGRHYLRRIDEGCQAMDKLIEGLLVLSRLGKTSMEYAPVDLSGLAQLIADDLRMIDPDRDATFVLGTDLKTEGDPVLLRSVLQNLMGNAWKFTGRRSKAVIEFGSSKIQGIPTPVYFVRDNGCGFDMTFAEKIFKPFQRFHSAKEFPGMGIGLASACKIVERHGGRMWAESELGRGTTVFFSLPPPLRDVEA
ncbi:MAG TPA: hypothetical protein DCR97_05930 [Deltaproteobacteria bacterium]|nr:hypothetical protein [Deltaproteobacteria bacterium]